MPYDKYTDFATYKTEKINLLYILSNGRSGSTILDLLLGSFDQIWTLGECQLIELELAVDAICGSGEKIRESAYWTEVLTNLELKNEQTSIAHFRKTAPGTTAHVGRVLRWRLLYDLYLKNKLGPVDMIAEYARLNARFFQAAKAAAEKNAYRQGIDWLVDASKDPYRLMWLQASGLFNIKVIHLLKHPCSFVYSNARLPEGGVHRGKIYRMIVRWLVENEIMRKVGRRFFRPKDVLTLKYEDLADRPQQTLKNIGAHFGIDLSDYQKGRFLERINFAISGNKSRWSGRDIFLDERWKKELPSFYQKVVWRATRKFARKYGYE